jgi:acid phosphatase family membrane protein YuiD
MEQFPIYLAAPFFAWFVTGITKFLINSVKERRLAIDLIGYGGMPSNHTAIVSSVAALIAILEGIHTPAFGVAVALIFIIALDANSLRQKVGLQAAAINRINRQLNNPDEVLRERMGHSKAEILAGVISGTASSLILVELVKLF